MRTTGAIGFEGLRELNVAGALAALATILMERVRAYEQAKQAAVATEAELFRGAVLDALAHEFKTPLATILTAAGGLREAGPLRPEQLELAHAVESEASRLEQLTTRLLRLARLDREEVKPQMELIDLGEVTRSVVEQHSRRWPDRHLVLKDAKAHVMGDRELLWLGLAQLLDNACKYSRPGSEVAVSVESADKAAVVRVWNSGSSIPSSEQARIFKRCSQCKQFFRCADLGALFECDQIVCYDCIPDWWSSMSMRLGVADRERIEGKLASWLRKYHRAEVVKVTAGSVPDTTNAQFQMAAKCLECSGTGKLMEGERCRFCNGLGSVRIVVPK
jgi:His Kinase A (phospho-acceptor) domain